MSSTRASREEQDLEVQRLRTLIEHIRKQAETLQGAARRLPDGMSRNLGDQAEVLLRAADTILGELDEHERKSS